MADTRQIIAPKLLAISAVQKWKNEYVDYSVKYIVNKCCRRCNALRRNTSTWDAVENIYFSVPGMSTQQVIPGVAFLLKCPLLSKQLHVRQLFASFLMSCVRVFPRCFLWVLQHVNNHVPGT